MSIISWFKKKSVELSRTQIQQDLEQLVSVCNKVALEMKTSAGINPNTAKDIDRI